MLQYVSMFALLMPVALCAMVVSPEVSQALTQKRPVVALESTIITHGMPYPVNVETALAVEQVVREEGAIPATIGVVDGEIVVGLSEEQIETLAKSSDVLKLSSRDLPLALSQGRSGGTTVAGTLAIAQKVNIPVFATGGIGGVHREADKTFDVSADLLALSKTSVITVCAGPKSILDIGLTLEKLETLNVCVIGYRCDEVPAFYYPNSGHLATHRLDSPLEIAQFAQANEGFSGGPLVTVPVPDAFAADKAQIEGVIDQALAAAKEQGIQGKELTPFLLSYVGDAGLKSNVALIKNNAKVAAQIAKALASLQSPSPQGQ